MGIVVSILPKNLKVDLSGCGLESEDILVLEHKGHERVLVDCSTIVSESLRVLIWRDNYGRSCAISLRWLEDLGDNYYFVYRDAT